MYVLKLDVRCVGRTSHPEPAMSAGDWCAKITEPDSERLPIAKRANQERNKSDDCASGNG